MIVAQDKTGCCGLSRKPLTKRKRNLPRIQVTGGQRFVFTALVMACFGVGLLITFYFAHVFALGYQINNLEKELARLRVESHSLETEIHRLASLDRVEKVAMHELGMVKPDNEKVLLIALSAEAARTEEQEINNAAGTLADGLSVGNEKSRLIEAFAEIVNRLEQGG